MDILDRSLRKHGFNAAALHGDMDQGSRTKTLEAFKSDKIRLLVASDVAARGLDIPDVSHIFNFDVPMHPEDYVHRIGRTGRAGKTGHAFTIVSPEDRKYLKGVEELLGRKIDLVDMDGIAPTTEGEEEEKPRERSSRGGRRNGRSRRSNSRDEQKNTEPEAPEAKKDTKAKTSRSDRREARCRWRG